VPTRHTEREPELDRPLQGRYRLLEPLGRGGMATVYRGRDERSKRNVAVKVIAEHLAGVPLFVNRFRHEVEVSARLRHPNIVRILDAGDEPRSHMVMELVDGPDLGSLLARRRRLTPNETVHLVASVCDALAFAHERGVVHGDVSHRNILLRRSNGAVKLADFGLSSSVGEDGAPCPATMIGTAGYVAPDVLWGARQTPRSDLYSLGVITYRLLAGPPGARHGDADVTAPMATAAPRMTPLADVRPDLPPRLVSAVQRASAPQAHARHESVVDFRQDLIAGLNAFLASQRRQASAGLATAA
jgi:serine/threonine protein kinase